MAGLAAMVMGKVLGFNNTTPAVQEELTVRDIQFRAKLLSVLKEAATEAGLQPQLLGPLEVSLLRLPISQVKAMAAKLVQVADELRPYVE